MNDLLIHIGYHKTGTTWLQRELFITSNEVFEPVSRWHRHKSSLGFSFVYGDDGYLLSPFEDNLETIKKEFLQLLKNKQNIQEKILVISNERLSGHYGSTGFDAQRIAHRIHKVFPHARIFITIREQKSFIYSGYFQYLSMGGLFSLKKYLNLTKRDYRMPFFSPHHLNYNPLIKEYYSLFGKENVLVLPFELFKTAPNEYFNLLGNFLKKTISLEPHQLTIKHNVKPYFFTLYYLRWLNIFLFNNSHSQYSSFKSKYTKMMVRKMLNVLHRIIPQRWNLSIKERCKTYIENWVGARYEKNNKELSQLIGIDLSKYGYY